MYQYDPLGLKLYKSFWGNNLDSCDIESSCLLSSGIDKMSNLSFNPQNPTLLQTNESLYDGDMHHMYGYGNRGGNKDGMHIQVEMGNRNNMQLPRITPPTLPRLGQSPRMRKSYVTRFSLASVSQLVYTVSFRMFYQQVVILGRTCVAPSRLSVGTSIFLLQIRVVPAIIKLHLRLVWGTMVAGT